MFIKRLIATTALVFTLLAANFAIAATVNVNTADANTLAQVLVGVGETKAEAIIEYREQHGPFSAVDELVKVKGIGNKTLSKNKANITLE